MYFANLNGLVESIKSDKEFHKKSHGYLIANMVLGFLLSAFSSLGGDPTMSLPAQILGDLIGAIILSFIVFAAIMRFYRINGGENGQYFVDKLVQLNWILDVQLMMVPIPLMVISVILSRMVSVVFSLFTLGIIVGMIVYTIKKIGGALADIRKHELAAELINVEGKKLDQM